MIGRWFRGRVSDDEPKPKPKRRRRKKPAPPKPQMDPPEVLARGEPEPAADSDQVFLFNRGEIARMWKVAPPTVDRWRDQCRDMYDPEDPRCPFKDFGGRGREMQIDAELLKRHLDAQDQERQQRAEAKREQERRLVEELDLQGGDDRGLGKMSHKERQQYYEAERVRMLVDRERGELLRRDEVKTTLALVFRFLRGQLAQVPDVLERELSLEPEVLDKLEAAIAKIQNELAGKLMRYETEDLERQDDKLELH